MFRVERRRIRGKVRTWVWEPYSDASHRSVTFEGGKAWGDVRTRTLPRDVARGLSPCDLHKAEILNRALAEEAARALAAVVAPLSKRRDCEVTNIPVLTARLALSEFDSKCLNMTYSLKGGRHS